MGLVLTVLLALAQTRLPANSDIDNIGTRDINRRSVNFMSVEKEIALGLELSQEVERTAKLLDDVVVNQYVNRITQKVAMNSDAKIPIQIKVIESDEVNASSLPGGFIYVNTGLIRAAASEAELAFVLAHAIADVAARHGAEQTSKGQLLNIATIPLIFLTASPRGMAFVSPPRSSETLVSASFYQFTRRAVEESDYLGIQYLYTAGYDPVAAVSLLLKITEPQNNTTHPPIPDRILALEKNIGLILPKRATHIENTEEFNAIKARLSK